MAQSDVLAMVRRGLARLPGLGRGRAAGPGPRGAASKGGALGLLDVDDLKGLNASSDFDTGDRLLNAIDDTLRRALPKGLGVERSENGRFVLWLPGLGLDDAAALTERLRHLAASVVVEGTTGLMARTLSAGVVRIGTDESRNRAVLHADSVLARAKALGGNRTETARAITSPSILPTRAEVEAAIDSAAIEYHLQPIADLRDRGVAGFEALLRWRKDDGAVVGPAPFVDTLDRIPEAGSERLADLACAAARPLLAEDGAHYVTFNITGAVLDGQNSPGCRWMRHLLDTLPPDRMVFEIVETAIVVNPARAADLIDKLRAQGLRIALDDFGTGLSNLERLRRFPVDILKIDRSFVDGLGGAGREEAILASLVTLAERLGTDIVAEGIETERQVETVRDLGIHFGQGYHLGRPARAMNWLGTGSDA
ncbi:GGDEF domain-containing phosphodiesterase [Jannaschia sp. KMU-145]|uniref:GGDEF domain-containing phosphodiesterase n=1 Tax=Jannaschia halovivens TaxID=3388667 RepID=UPI00396B080B